MKVLEAESSLGNCGYIAAITFQYVEEDGRFLCFFFLQHNHAIISYYVII